MKFTSSDFFVGRTPLYASENGIVYDDPILKSEEVWNNLMEYYENKEFESNTEMRQEAEFYRALARCRVENETGITCMQLVSQNVLRLYKTTESSREYVNIKPYIIENLRRYLDYRRRELIENIQNEKKVYDIIKTSSSDIRLEDRKIRIYHSCVDFVEFSELKGEPVYRSKGITCKLVYKGLVFVCSQRKTCTDPYNDATECFVEKSLIQCFSREHVKIEITNEETEGKNIVCDIIISELKRGKSLSDLYTKIIFGLSRYLLDCLLTPYKDIQIVENSIEKAIDGRSEMFFVFADDDLFKIVRDKDSFDIYLDGEPITFKTL